MPTASRPGMLLGTEGCSEVPGVSLLARRSLTAPPRGSEVCLGKPLLNSTLLARKRAAGGGGRGKPQALCAALYFIPLSGTLHLPPSSSSSEDTGCYTLKSYAWQGLGRSMTTGENSGSCPFPRWHPRQPLGRPHPPLLLSM